PRSATHIRESGASTRQSARTSARRSSRRATSPTVAPRRARIRASAAPIPDDAPVTSTRDPSIFMGASSGRFLGARSGSVDHGSRNTTMAILDDIRRIWDDDAATYDDAPGHHPTSAAGQSAGRDPPAPSSQMLAKRSSAAGAEGLDIAVVVAPAHEPPGSPGGHGFDSVIERHLLWTLPDPIAALRA